MYWNESHVNELMWWIDTPTLSRTTLDALQEEDVEPTVENAKKVWLDFLLTELGDGLKNSVKALINKGELKTTE